LERCGVLGQGKICARKDLGDMRHFLATSEQGVENAPILGVLKPYAIDFSLE
jgi:hypothetical protein